MIYPHQITQKFNTEAHFMRLWRTYQCFTLKEKAKAAVDAGRLSNEDMAAAGKFLQAKGSKMNVTSYVYAKAGLRPALEQDEGFLAADRVMTAIGMNDNAFDNLTAADPET